MAEPEWVKRAERGNNARPASLGEGGMAKLIQSGHGNKILL